MVNRNKMNSRVRSQAPAWRLRPLCAALLLAGAQEAALALPTGGQVVSGQVSVQTVSPNQMNITETSSSGIVNWQGFSIGSGQLVRVVQPGASATLLNRVVGVDPSLILGHLSANGQVFLINPRGIVFGAGSQVDAGSFVASTLGISDQDFKAGKYSLLAGSATPGALQANGTILAPNGTVVLVAPQLSVSGDISAHRIGLAAAGSAVVDVEGDGLVLFDVSNAQNLSTRLDMLGRLHADGGTVDMRAQARAGFADTVLNMDGIVQARSIGTRNGQVVIDGGSAGITQVGGSVDVSGRGAGQTGGTAAVLGDRVALLSGSTIDASGAAGGGTVHVGGDFHGSGPDRDASMTLVQSGANILADAVQNGNGGQVSIWSNQATGYYGGLSARGGALGGNGGSAEVSSHLYLDMQGSSDLGAAHGSFGNLLLDPRDLTIGTTAAVDGTSGHDLDNTAGTTTASGTSLTFNYWYNNAGAPTSPSAGGTPLLDSGVTATAVQNLLATNNLTLQAWRNIVILSDITVGAGGANQGSLTIQAGNNLVLGTSTGVGTAGTASHITTNGTNVTLQAGTSFTNEPTQPSGQLLLVDGSSISTFGNISGVGSGKDPAAGNGSISLSGRSVAIGTGVSLLAAGVNGAVTHSGSVSITSASGALALPSMGTVSLTVNSGGDVTQIAGAGIQLKGTAGSGTLTVNETGTSQNVALTNTGNDFNGDAIGITGTGNIGVVDTNAAFPNVTLSSGTLASLVLTDTNAAAAYTLGNTGTITVSGPAGGTNAAGGTDALVIDAGGGVTVNGTLAVTGTTSLNGHANAVNASNAANTFSGNVAFAGSNVTLAAGGALQSSGTASGNLGETAGGNITEGSAGIQMTGTATANTASFSSTATGATVNLSSTANNFNRDALTVAGTGGGSVSDVALTDANATSLAPLTLPSTLHSLVLSDPSAASAVVLPTLTISGFSGTNAVGGTLPLVVSSGSGGISNAGNLNVTGASQFTATGGPITLGGTGHTFTDSGNVAFAGAAVNITTTGNLQSSGIASGNLTETANGNITEGTAGIQMTGTAGANTASFASSATGATVNLSSTSNNFKTDAVSVAGSGAGTVTDVAVTDSNAAFAGLTLPATLHSLVLADPTAASAVAIPAVTISGFSGTNAVGGTVPLVVSAGSGGITQSGIVSVTGASQFNSTGGAVTLGGAVNTFTGSGNVAFTGTDVSITDTAALSSSGTASASLTEVAGGNITQGGNLSAGTTGSFTATGNSITLGGTGHTFTAGSGNVAFSGQNVSITSTGALQSSGTATGTLVELANGAITQGGNIDLTGGTTASFTATGTGNDITVGGTGHTFTPGSGDVSFSGRNVSITSTGALASSGTTTGSLTEVAAGAITQGGNISVGTTGSFTATGAGNDITLGGATNTFTAGTGNVAFSGGNVSITSTNALQTSGTASGNLSETAGGNISEGASGITLTGTAGTNTAGFASTATGAAVNLFNASNAFNGEAVTIAGSGTGTVTDVAIADTAATFALPSLPATLHSLELSDANSAIALPATTISGFSGTNATGGNIALVVNAGSGGISQTGNVIVNGASQFTSTGTVTLGGANTFTPGGNVAFSGTDVSITSTGALQSSGTASGNLTEAASGNISEGAAGIQLTGTAGTNTATFSSSGTGVAVNLFNASNSFNGEAVTIASTGAGTVTDVAIADTASSFTLPALPANLHSLELSDPNSAIALPATTISNFSGTNATGGSTALVVNAGSGGISQTGSVSVGAPSQFTSTGPVTLGGAVNTFTPGGNVSFSGTDVSITSTGALQSSGAATASLTEVAGGAITQGGVLSAGTTASFTASGNAITLGGANAFTAGSGGVAFSGSDVSITSTGALATSGTATSTLTEQAAGPVTQSGNIDLTGASTASFTATGGNNITLGGTGHTLNPGTANVAFSGQSVSITSTGALKSSGSTTGTLTEVAAGNISQGGNISVGTTSDFTATGGTLTLGSGGTFTPGGNVAITANAATITTTGALSTSGSVTGLLTETTGSGNISNGAALSVGSANLTAGGNDITLGGTTNTFASTGNVAFSGRNVNLTTTGALSSSGTATGTLTEAAAGAISQGAAITAGTTSSFTAGANAITLGAAGTSFTPGGNVALSGGNVSVTSTGALSTSGVVSGNLTEVAAGTITQGGGLTVGGTSSLTATGFDITMGGPNGSYTAGGNVAFSGANVSLTTTGALSSSGTATGTLSETAGGAITQGGALIANTTSTFVATGNDITLGTSSTFTPGGLVLFSGRNVTVDSTGALTSEGTATAGLSETAAGNITEGPTGIQLSGTPGTDAVDFTVTGASHDILLTNASNNFHGQTITLAGTGGGAVGNVAITDTSNAFSTAGNHSLVLPSSITSLVLDDTASQIALPAVTLTGVGAGTNGAGGTTTLDVTAAGIGQSGAVSVTGVTNLVAQGGGAIALGGANAFTPNGSVAFSGGNVSLTSTGALSSSGTTTGTLTEAAGGAITQSGSITVGSSSSFSAPGNTITLGGTNTFTPGGNVAFNGSDVSITSTGALSSSGTTTATLSETAGGDISQGGDVTVGTTATYQAGANNITLGGGGNAFSAGGNVAVTGNNVSINSATALASSGTVGGTLAETAAGAITQGGTLNVAGTSTLNAGSNAITMGGANAYTAGGAVQFTGGAVSLTTTGALASGGTAATLSETAAGAITQSSNLTVTGATTLSAGANAITLGGAHAFNPGANVAFAGGNVSLTSTGALSTSGTASGALNEAAGGAITQGGALVVSGPSTLDAGSNAITLGTAGNQFGGNVAFTGGNVSIASSGVLSTSGTATGNLVENVAGSLAQGAPLTVGGATSLTSTGDIVLGNTGNTFSGPVTFSGNNVTVDAGGALNSGGTAAGTLTETAGGDIDQSGTWTANALAVTSGGNFNQTQAVTVANGGNLSAQQVHLGANLNVNGGTLTLVATAAPPAGQHDTLLNSVAQVPGTLGVPLVLAGNTVNQTAGVITVANGGELAVQATGYGSVSLMQAGNDFTGGLAVLSGPAYNTAWSPARAQGLIELTGGNINVTGPGIEGDVVRITADQLATLGSAKIVARLPFDSQIGSSLSEPDVVLTLGPNALAHGLSLGAGNAPLAIVAGSTATGNRAFGPNAGFITVRPKGGGQGNAIFIAGPVLNVAGYQFFYDGSGKLSEVPVFYNGQLPKTPQLSGALASVAAIAEQARRDRFEETVRTENVAIRLRNGVISEVGPGRPATTGTEGAAPPPTCSSSGSGLGCNAD